MTVEGFVPAGTVAGFMSPTSYRTWQRSGIIRVTFMTAMSRALWEQGF